MSTKPDTDTGWTDRSPYKPNSGDEYHFVRRKDGRDVVIMGFSMGKAWLNGVSYEPFELRSHLFLGPLRPEDFEQLIRLRNHIKEAQEVIESLRTFWIDLGDNDPAEWHWCDPDRDCDGKCERARALMVELAQRPTGEES